MLKFVLLLLSVSFPGSHQQCFTRNDSVPFITQQQYLGWVKSQHSFSVSLFKMINDDVSHQNIILSPSNIYDVLMLAYFGAARETEAALADVLQLPARQTKPISWLFYSNQKAQNFDNDMATNTVNSASKIFLSNKLNLRRCLAENLKAELELIDYKRDVVGAKNYINNWVASQTAGQIRNLIKSLPPAATATLVSAVYFKAKWLNEFDPKRTGYFSFHVNRKQIMPTRMMVKIGFFDEGYSDALQARLVVLPYQGERTAMIIILPDNDLDPMISVMTERSLSMITTPHFYTTSQLEIYIPKFEHSSNIGLNTELVKLGIGNTLSAYADFSGFTGRREVFFKEMIHEAKIQVDEEGTTASAATFGGGAESLRIPESFVCNRPFAYIIYDYSQSKILFMGAFREPSPP